jgi:hypothetical protein
LGYRSSGWREWRDGGDPDERELSRLCIIMDLRDTRLSVAAAAALLGIGRRQVFVCARR